MALVYPEYEQWSGVLPWSRSRTIHAGNQIPRGCDRTQFGGVAGMCRKAGSRGFKQLHDMAPVVEQHFYFSFIWVEPSSCRAYVFTKSALR